VPAMHVLCLHRPLLHRLRPDPRPACTGARRYRPRLLVEPGRAGHAGTGSADGAVVGRLAITLAAASDAMGDGTKVLADPAAVLLDRPQSALVSVHAAGTGLSELLQRR